MNPARALYCRAFQKTLRAALPFLPYREPKLYRSTDRLLPLLRELGVRSLLLVTDGTLRARGMTAELEASLAAAGIACAVYDKTCPNPTVDNVEEALLLYEKEECECLIAFGGGSPIDCAKAVGARVAYPKKSIGQMKGILRVLRRLPPLIAIPTTAGTGSEVTLAAVITDRVTHHKYTLNSFPLIPTYAVLDPRLTVSLPPHLTATTGMDALTHAVEAYIGGSTTRETRAKARRAVKLIFMHLENAYRDGKNIVAREGMLHASYLAGVSFSKSYVGYIHAVAHSLGGEYNIPHGLANAVLLPIVLEEYGAAVYGRLAELAVDAGLASADEPSDEAARRLIRAIREMNRRMDIPERLSGIRVADIPRMAERADREANPLYPVPHLMDAEELKRLYYRVKDWSEDDEQN